METVPVSFQEDAAPPSFQEDAAPQQAAAPQRTQEQIDKPPVSGLGPTAKQLGVGAYHFIKDILDFNVPVYGDGSKILDPAYHGEPNSLWNKYVASPAIAEGKKAEELRKLPGYGAQIAGNAHELASYIPFLGPMAAQAGEQLGQAKSTSDVAGGVLSGGMALLGARGAGKAQPESASTVGDVFKASNKGQIVQSAHGFLEKGADGAKTELAVAQANVGTRVGDLVRDISDADLAEVSAKGRMGSMKTAPANDVLMSAIDKYGANFQKMPNVAQALQILQSAPPSMPWEMMKDVRSAIGQLTYKATEGSKERAVLQEVRVQLTKQMAARAQELDRTDQFNAYNTLWEKMLEHQHDGALGKLYNADTGLKFFDTLKKPSNGPGLESLQKDLGEFGLADNFFKGLRDSHAKTYELAKQSEGQGGGFVGKFKALGKHPVAAGGAALGVGLLPLPGKFIWSLMAASKAADLADRVSAAKEMRMAGGAPEVTGKFGSAAKVKPKGEE